MLILLILILALAFAVVIFFGAPYLPTLNRQTKSAMDLMGAKPGQTLIELGSGDGRVMRYAASKGLNVIGYELNPILVLISYIYTFKYRNSVKIIWGNYWVKEMPEADYIFVFLIDRYMKKLNKKVEQYEHKPVKLVSFAFKIPGRDIKAEKDGLFLYEFH